jgi:hypothetical protein
MSAAETLRGHAWAAVRMAEQASVEDRRCLIALAQTWFKQAEQADKQQQAPRQQFWRYERAGPAFSHRV